MRVLVTDGDSRAGLAVVRSLGRAGHWVAVGERSSWSLGQMSRHCAERVRYADPVTNQDGFVEGLLEDVRRLNVDVVVPVTDVTTFLISQARERFERHCRVPVASLESLTIAADKAATVQLAEKLGVATPATRLAGDVESAVAAMDSLPLPVVIKPRRSRVRDGNRWVSCSVRYATTRDELARIVGVLPREAFPVLLQERIPGPGVGIFTCYDRGREVALFSHRRLREKPPSGGVSVLAESVAPCPTATDYARRLMSELAWQGVAMIEFKRDSRDGIPKLMEINGRFWGSLQLAVDAGVDFPAILLETLNGRTTTALSTYRTGVKSRWFWGDLDSLLLTLFKSGQQHGDVPKGRAVARFLRLWEPNLYYDNPRFDDVMPWLYETQRWFRSALRA
jgi:predicted ATP-grasp superfamily ATP-dependent carboligase